MKKLLVTIADKNYLNLSKQLFINSTINGNWQYDMMLITTRNIEDEKLKWFYDNGIHIRKYDYFFPKDKWYTVLPKGVLDPIVCSKLYLFSNEFKKWNKILYIDTDTIVRFPVDEITRVQKFGAIRNVNNPFLHKHFSYPNRKNNKVFVELKKNFDLFSRAFNAGVFCFDTTIIDDFEIIEEFKILFNKYGSIAIYSEQSILNLLFYKKWKSYPLYFNYDVNRNINNHNINPKKITAKVLHFNGNNKPWEKDSIFFNEWSQNKGLLVVKKNSEYAFSDKDFQFKYLLYNIYSITKKIVSFKIKFLIRHILLNFFPSLYMLFKYNPSHPDSNVKRKNID